MTSRTGSRIASRTVPIGPFRIGAGQPLVLFAGPCVIESEAHAMRMAQRLVKIAAAAKIPFVFKASYDKANRSSISSYRGPGLAAGLAVLRKIKDRFGVPLLTDIHEPSHATAAAEVCDCRIDTIKIRVSDANREMSRMLQERLHTGHARMTT